jgi:hypothetical protein
MWNNITVRLKEMWWECLRTIFEPEGKEIIKDEK